MNLPALASINALHVLYAGDWIDGTSNCHAGVSTESLSGESGDRFVLNFEDDSEEEVESTSVDPPCACEV